MANRFLLSATLGLLLSGTVAAAGNQVRTLRWSELQASGKLEVGEIVPASTAGEEELLIVNETAQPLKVHLATLEPTSISKHLYTVRGRIRYENVEEPGYIEMWNRFADGSNYFSRTLGTIGLMAKIHGTSSGREFVLPFQGEPHLGPPSRLEINLVLPARGKVWIGPLTVNEFSKQEWGSAMTSTGAWWGNGTGGMIGGILGALIGILGGLVGTLRAWGRGKTVCVTICWFVIGLGVICLLTGIIALFASQPYAVYYPLLLIGILATAIMGSVLRTIGKQFADLELRKMEALDAGLN